jgi:hypothetical protein
VFCNANQLFSLGGNVIIQSQHQIRKVSTTEVAPPHSFTSSARANPNCLRQHRQQAAVEAARGAIVDVLDASLLA